MQRKNSGRHKSLRNRLLWLDAPVYVPNFQVLQGLGAVLAMQLLQYIYVEHRTRVELI